MPLPIMGDSVWQTIFPVYIRVTERGDQSRLLLFSLLSGFPFLTTHTVQWAIDFCASG